VSGPDAPSPARRHTAAIAVCLLAILAALSLRLFGASDLFQNTDQSRTMSFTADAVLNGEWLLPRDLLGDRTMKPPLVNWIGMPVFAMGLHSEAALKFPALLGGLATVVLVSIAGARLFARLDADGADRAIARFAAPLGVACGAAWLCSNSGLKHTYFLRPDIVMFAFLAGAFVCGIRANGPGMSGRPGPRGRWLLGLWLCAGLAALTKGPLALTVPLFLLVDAALRPRSEPPRPESAEDEPAASGDAGLWRRLASNGWWWGVPVMLAIPGLWIAAAWQVDPGHMRRGIFGAELGTRFDRTTVGFDPVDALGGLWRPFGFSIERFAPWSVLALIGVAAVLRASGRSLGRHAMRPAVSWTAAVLLINLVDAGRTPSALAPAYPAMAVLAVYGLARLVAGGAGQRARLAPVAAGALALVVGVATGAREAFFSRGAETRLGDRLAAFAREAERAAGDGVVVFIGTGHNPIPTLMGRHRLGDPARDEFLEADWVVMPLDDRFTPAVGSEPLVRQHAESGTARGRSPGLGLFERTAVPVSILDEYAGITEPDLVSEESGD
jgi:4-amino-4-deoxy-L-arabinose transferase-like glycosyltransferase